MLTPLLRMLAVPIGAYVTANSARKIARRTRRLPWRHDAVRSVIAWTVFGLCLTIWGLLEVRSLAVPAGLAVASIVTVRCSVHRAFNEHWFFAPARDVFFLTTGLGIVAYGLGIWG